MTKWILQQQQKAKISKNLTWKPSHRAEGLSRSFSSGKSEQNPCRSNPGSVARGNRDTRHNQPPNESLTTWWSPYTKCTPSETSQENDNTLERSGNKKLQPTCSSRQLPFQNHSKQHDKRRKDASNSNSPLTIPSITTTKRHSHTNTITHSNKWPRTEQTLQSQHYGQRRTISTKYCHLQPLPATSQFTRESTQKESLRQQAPPPKLQRKHQEEEHKGTLNGVTTTKMLNKMNTSSEKFTVPNDTA